jgi:hypothetical protein
VAAVRLAALQLDEARVEFQVGVGEREEGIEVAPVEGVIAQVEQLDVLLRHRLLLKPGGFGAPAQPWPHTLRP